MSGSPPCCTCCSYAARARQKRRTGQAVQEGSLGLHTVAPAWGRWQAAVSEHAGRHRRSTRHCQAGSMCHIWLAELLYPIIQQIPSTCKRNKACTQCLQASPVHPPSSIIAWLWHPGRSASSSCCASSACTAVSLRGSPAGGVTCRSAICMLGSCHAQHALTAGNSGPRALKLVVLSRHLMA
jgi:hypothetical protein